MHVPGCEALDWVYIIYSIVCTCSMKSITSSGRYNYIFTQDIQGIYVHRTRYYLYTVSGQEKNIKHKITWGGAAAAWLGGAATDCG